MKIVVYARLHVSTALLACLLLRGLQICSAKARESDKYGLRLCTEGSNKTNHDLFVSAKRKSPTYMNRAPRLSGLQVSVARCRMRCECANWSWPRLCVVVAEASAVVVSHCAAHRSRQRFAGRHNCEFCQNRIRQVQTEPCSRLARDWMHK